MFSGKSVEEWFKLEAAGTHARAILTPAPVSIPIPAMATVPCIRGPAGTYAGITGNALHVWTAGTRDSFNL
jgi:hypothetical protein